MRRGEEGGFEGGRVEKVGALADGGDGHPDVDLGHGPTGSRRGTALGTTGSLIPGWAGWIWGAWRSWGDAGGCGFGEAI